MGRPGPGSARAVRRHRPCPRDPVLPLGATPGPVDPQGVGATPDRGPGQGFAAPRGAEGAPGVLQGAAPAAFWSEPRPDGRSLPGGADGAWSGAHAAAPTGADPGAGGSGSWPAGADGAAPGAGLPGGRGATPGMLADAASPYARGESRSDGAGLLGGADAFRPAAQVGSDGATGPWPTAPGGPAFDGVAPGSGMPGGAASGSGMPGGVALGNGMPGGPTPGSATPGGVPGDGLSAGDERRGAGDSGGAARGGRGPPRR